MHSVSLISLNMFHPKTSVLVTFSSTVYTATEGMDPKVTITVLANGAVEDSDFSIRVIAKDGTATSGYILHIYNFIHSVYIVFAYITMWVASIRMWAHQVEMRAYACYKNLQLKLPFCCKVSG